MSETLARIPLDRRVCIGQSDRIDLRPERAAIVGPTLGLIISAALFAAMAFWSNHLPLGPLAVMLLAAIILTPFSGMAFVYSLIGAAVEGRHCLALYLKIYAIAQTCSFEDD